MKQIRHNHGKLRAIARSGLSTRAKSAVAGNALCLLRRLAYDFRQKLDCRSVTGLTPDKIKARIKIYSHKAPEAQALWVRPLMNGRTCYADTHIGGNQRKSHGFHWNLLNDARLRSGRDAGSYDLVEGDRVEFSREAQDRIGREVGNADLGPAAQRMVRRHDHEAVKGAYPFSNQSRFAHAALNHSQINLATAQVMEDLATACHDLDDHLDIVRHVPKRGECLANEAQLSGKSCHADPHGSRASGRIPSEMRLGISYALKNWSGVSEQDFPRRQQLGTARQSQKKWQAKLFFQLVNSPGQSRLCDVEYIGRTLEAAFFSNSDEIMKPSKIQITLHN